MAHQEGLDVIEVSSTNLDLSSLNSSAFVDQKLVKGRINLPYIATQKMVTTTLAGLSAKVDPSQLKNNSIKVGGSRVKPSNSYIPVGVAKAHSMTRVNARLTELKQPTPAAGASSSAGIHRDAKRCKALEPLMINEEPFKESSKSELDPGSV